MQASGECALRGLLCLPIDSVAWPLASTQTASTSALVDGACPADRAVLSEWVQRHGDRLLPGRMVRQDRWKLITFDGLDGADLLFDMQEDPDELHDLADARRDVAGRLKEVAENGWEPDRVRARYAEKSRHIDIVRKWGSRAEVDESEAWQAPPEACAMPEIAE